MGHCVQAIVTTSAIADELQAIYPQIPRVTARQGFVILPVDAEFVDSAAESRPEQSSEAFKLLTAGFHELLRKLSRLGPLAYIETDYFGGVGGQGAAVYSCGEVVMEPEWRESGPINQALGLIGVKRRLLGDRFRALGLDAYRSNDALVDAATRGNDPPSIGAASSA
jgi:hypothetical protein